VARDKNVTPKGDKPSKHAATSRLSKRAVKDVAQVKEPS